MQNEIEKYLQLINRFILAYNNFDVESLKEFIDEKLEFKNISHGEIVESTSTLIEFTLILEQSKALFSKRDVQIENINIHGKLLEATIFYKATMAISTIDGLKAGQEINFKGSFTFTIENDKINKIVQVS